MLKRQLVQIDIVNRPNLTPKVSNIATQSQLSRTCIDRGLAPCISPRCHRRTALGTEEVRQALLAKGIRLEPILEATLFPLELVRDVINEDEQVPIANADAAVAVDDRRTSIVEWRQLGRESMSAAMAASSVAFQLRFGHDEVVNLLRSTDSSVWVLMSSIERSQLYIGSRCVVQRGLSIEVEA
jgi:hypothetical protein